MTLELIATLTLIASHVVLTAIGFWIGWKLGKDTGYLEAEYEIAAIASEPLEAGHDCRFFKAANGECMACSVLENRKQSSPFTLAEEGEWIPWDGCVSKPWPDLHPDTLVRFRTITHWHGDQKVSDVPWSKVTHYRLSK